MDEIDEIKAFLRTDPLKYVVQLKMLEVYADGMTWQVERAGGEYGLVLLLPAELNPFDARTYPGVRYVVMLAASHPAVVERLVLALPRRDSLVFKLPDAASVAAVLSVFPARRKTAYISYTPCKGYTPLRGYAALGSAFPLDPAVVISGELDDRLVPCYQANGYTRPELERCFQQGSVSYSLFAGEPLSTCFVFKNYERIWEIGGVYTAPACRRQGLARRVVSAALHDLLAQGKIPRYQVVESNTASRGLAEALGLEPFVTTEHYLYQP